VHVEHEAEGTVVYTLLLVRCLQRVGRHGLQPFLLMVPVHMHACAERAGVRSHNLPAALLAKVIRKLLPGSPPSARVTVFRLSTAREPGTSPVPAPQLLPHSGISAARHSCSGAETWVLRRC